MDRNPPRRVTEIVATQKNSTALSERPGFFQRIFRRGNKAQKPEEKKNIEFDRGEFTPETGTLNEKKVSFGPELQAQYSTYLDNHLTRLARVYNNDPNSAIFAAPEFRHQKMLLDTLAEKGADNTYTIDKEKIESALHDDPDLWIVTTQIMEEDIALTLAGLGLMAEVQPGAFSDAESTFDATVNPQNISLNINKGRMRKLVGGHSVLAEFGLLSAGALTTPPGRQLITQVMALAAQHGPQILAAAGPYAGLGAAAVAGLIGAKSLFREGASIDISRNSELLTRLKTPGAYPAEVQYLQDVIGLGVSDFAPTWSGGVTRLDTNPTSIDSSKIQANLVSQLWTRFQFYNEGLGIPAEKINMISENLTFSQTRGNVRGELTTWGQDMLDIRNRKTAEFIDRTGIDPNPEEQMMIEIESRREVITSRLERRLVKQAPSERVVTDLTKLDTSLSTGDSKGEIIINRTKQLTETSTILEGSTTEIRRVEGTLREYQEKLRAYHDVMGEAERSFGTSILAELDQMLENRNSINDAELQEIRRKLYDAEEELRNVESQGNYIDGNVASARALVANLTGFDAILTPAHAVGLSRRDLATLPMDEIFYRVNTANVRSVALGHAPLGWPVPNNNNPALRQALLFAIAEARAAEAEPAVGAPSADYLRWTGIGVALSDSFLRSATVDSAVAELQRRGAPGISIPAATAAEIASVQSVLREVQRAYHTRQQKLKEVLDQEPTQRAEYNDRVAEDKRILEALRGTVQTQNDALIALETNRDRMRSNTSQIAERFIENHLGDQVNALDLITRIHVASVASGTAIAELDPAFLHTRSLQDILNGIHTAHAAGFGLAWDAAADTDPGHIRAVLSARAEAQAGAALAGDLSTDNRAMTELKGFGLSEQQIRTIPEEDIMRECVRRGWSNIDATRVHIKTAIDLARQRSNVRRTKLSENLNHALSEARAGRIPSMSTAAIAYLETDTDYNATTANIARSLAQIRTINPGLAGVVDSTGSTTFISGLQGQIASMRALSDLSGNITAIRTQFEQYDTALKTYLSQRNEAERKVNGAQTVEAIDREVQLRARHTTTELEGLITRLRDTRKEVLPTAESSSKARAEITAETDALVRIRQMDADLVAGGGAAMLNPADLLVGGVDQVMLKINLMCADSINRGIVPPIGWLRNENNDPEHVNFASQAMAAARAEARIARIAAAATPVVLADIATSSAWFDEYTFLMLSPQELVSESNRQGHLLTIDQARDILQVRRDILDSFRDANSEAANSNDTRGKEVQKEVSRIEESYDRLRSSVAFVRGLTEKQGEVFSRIPDLIGAAYLTTFSRPIAVGSRVHTDEEKGPMINGVVVPNLPKGYFDILHLLTGYQGNMGKGRGIAFNEALNIPLLHPNEIALQLNKHLNMNLHTTGPITIERAIEQIELRVNHRTLNKSDIYFAVRAMRDDFIAQFGAIS